MAHIFITSSELRKLTDLHELPRQVAFKGEIKDTSIVWSPVCGWVDKMVTITSDFIKQTFGKKVHIVKYDIK